MPIRNNTTKTEIDNVVSMMIERFHRALIRQMCYIGERCLKAARSTNTYKDQTGNLRSSIGYVVVEDGKIAQMSSFQQVKDGKTGTQEGRDFVLKLVDEFPKGIVLIVVAGMNYAAYVEAKGKDVIEGSELLAEKLVPEMLRKLGIEPGSLEAALKDFYI